MTLAFPHIRLLPDDRVLVVDNKCVWRPSGPDRNAVLYDADGNILAEQTWGDDIVSLEVAMDGTIWAGYGDMATSGSENGWGGPGPAPLGWVGLIRYEPDGLHAIWHFPPQNPWGPVQCCYALNTAADGAWMYYYSGFPIVRVTDRRLLGWRNDSVSGASALAVDYPNVALLGGYGPDADLLTVGGLNDDRLEIRKQYRLVMPDGTPLARQAFIGRGPTLHMVHAHNWYQLSSPTWASSSSSDPARDQRLD